MVMFLPYGDRFLPLGTKPVACCLLPYSRRVSTCGGVFTLRGKFLPFGANKACGMLSGASISEHLWEVFHITGKDSEAVWSLFRRALRDNSTHMLLHYGHISPEIRPTRQLSQSNRPCKTFVYRGVKSEPILYHISSL